MVCICITTPTAHNCQKHSVKFLEAVNKCISIFSNKLSKTALQMITQNKIPKCQHTKIASAAPEDHTNSLKAKFSDLAHVCPRV